MAGFCAIQKKIQNKNTKCIHKQDINSLDSTRHTWERIQIKINLFICLKKENSCWKEDNRAEDLKISPQKFAPGSSGRQKKESKKELRIY